MGAVFLSQLLIFELNQQVVLVNFMLYLNIFKILKISFRTSHPLQAFRIAQCKQPRLIKP